MVHGAGFLRLWWWRNRQTFVEHGLVPVRAADFDGEP